jgi:hypothetical protein
MDIAGAKALKERLGSKAVEETPRPRNDVHEDAPPVYHWTGVSQRDSAAVDSGEAPADRSVSKFLRLGLSFR